MAITVPATFVKVDKRSIGDCFLTRTTVTFNDESVAGGQPVTKADLGFDNEIIHVFDGIARDPATADNMVLVTFDETNSKLVPAWVDSDGATPGPLVEPAAATDLTAYSIILVALGR